MIRSNFPRVAVIGVLVAVLGLAACGRKGPLDPPPGAALEGQNEPPAERSGLASPVGVSPLGGGGQSTYDPGVTSDGLPLPKGPNKRIPLDVLLN